MPPRRKPSSKQAATRSAVKRRKQERLLYDLPAEILNDILCHALPDVGSIDWIGNNAATGAFLTHPLLQTNRILRQTCLRLIHDTTLWVQIDPRDRILALEIGEWTNLPLLPRKLQHLVQPDAAKIRLCFGDMDGMDVRETRSHTKNIDRLVFPFSFDRLLYFLSIISTIAANTGSCKLLVQGYNLTSHPLHQVRDLMVPALSTVQRLQEFVFEIEDSQLDSEQIGPNATSWDYSLSELTARARDVLDRADELTSRGYSDEAGLLCFSSLWMIEEAEDIVPDADDWMEMGDTRLYDQSDFKPACNLMGNQLRTIMHMIEYRGRLCFARLVDKYGKDWLHSQPFLFHYVLEHFENNETAWFGLSVSESIELYYSRAICKEAISKIVFDNNSRVFTSRADRTRETEDRGESKSKLKENQYYKIGEAAVNMLFALILDPDNEHFQSKYDEYRRQLAPYTFSMDPWLDLSRIVIVRDQNDRTLMQRLKPLLWIGDEWMFDEWGGVAAVERLPLARTGCTNASPTFAEVGTRLNDRFENHDDYYKVLEEWGIPLRIIMYPGPDFVADDERRRPYEP